MRLASSLAPTALVVLLACGGGNGPPTPACGDPCTPTNVCRVGVISCATGSQVCEETGDVALDGTACGSGEVCSAGACVGSSTTRTIAATFQTVYQSDDGSTITIGEPPLGIANVTGLVVPDGSAEGYARFPVTAAADGTFEVTGVPVGRWFLQMDTDVFVPSLTIPGDFVRCTYTQLIPLATSTPDLTTVIAARPDLARVSSSTPVTADVSNLEPWVSGARLIVTSAQADVNEWPTLSAAPPAAGATSYTSQFDWQWDFGPRASGLPDPARGDVVFWYQRGSEPLAVSGGTATVRRAVRYARLDTLQILDGQPVTVSVPFVDAPQTGVLDVSVQTSAFAALLADVNPSAQLYGPSVQIFAVPHAVEYPAEPVDAERSLLSIDASTSSNVALTSTYGQFLGAPWQELRQFLITYLVEVVPGRTEMALITHREPVASASSAAAPVLGPPTDPLVEGLTAFATRTGVGLQPMLSWSPPRVGSATSYVVTVKAVGGARAGETVELSAVVDGATHFRIPPGFLTTGRSYYARITARQRHGTGRAASHCGPARRCTRPTASRVSSRLEQVPVRDSRSIRPGCTDAWGRLLTHTTSLPRRRSDGINAVALCDALPSCAGGASIRSGTRRGRHGRDGRTSHRPRVRQSLRGGPRREV